MPIKLFTDEPFVACLYFVAYRGRYLLCMCTAQHTFQLRMRARLGVARGNILKGFYFNYCFTLSLVRMMLKSR